MAVRIDREVEASRERFKRSGDERGRRQIMRTTLHVSNPTHTTADKDCAFGEDRSGAPPQKRRWTQTEGFPLPLGATWIEEEQAFNFAVYAEHAETVTLLLYGAEELANPILTFPFDFVHNKSGRIGTADFLSTKCGALVITPTRSRDRSFLPFTPLIPSRFYSIPHSQCVLFPPEFDRQAGRGAWRQCRKCCWEC